MTPEQFDKIVAEAKFIAFGPDLESGKHKDYNAQGLDLYKVIGLPGRISDLWRKAIRLPSSLKSEQYDVKLYRDVLDLLVYCVMFCLVWKEEKDIKEVTEEFLTSLKEVEKEEGRDGGVGNL